MLVLNASPGDGSVKVSFDRDPRAFHRRLPGYAPTPLIALPRLGRRLGVDALYVKDESCRFDMQSFKVLGGSWSTFRKLNALVDGRLDAGHDLERMRAEIRTLGRLELITATEGNHGRGVARTARWFGLDSRIFIRRAAATHRVEAMRAEGAAIEFVDGTYDDACDAALGEASRTSGALLIQDTSRPGYEDVPTWVIEGYRTIGAECDEQFDAAGFPAPDLVVVQAGVGALCAAMVQHYRNRERATRPLVFAVEPTDAACVARSVERGSPAVVPGPHRSMMNGMSCGVVAGVAWPWLRDGLAGVVTVEDGQAAKAMRDLHEAGIRAGASGAAGLAGLEALFAAGSPALRPLVRREMRVLLLVTEGPTDPDNWDRVIGA